MIYHHQKKYSIATTIGLSLLLVVGFVLYNNFAISKVHAEDPLSSDATAAPTDSPLSPEQAALLEKIKSLTLNGAIFTDPTFLGFTDWTQQLGHIDAGKPNPFLPLSGFSKPTQTKAKK